MATNNTLPPLPNPFTPLAFLPPVLANQLQASIYIAIASLSVSIILEHVGEYRLNFINDLFQGIHMGLAHVDSGRNRDVPQEETASSGSRVFPLSVSPPSLSLAPPKGPLRIGTLGYCTTSTVFRCQYTLQSRNNFMLKFRQLHLWLVAITFSM
jgi:hypothetical protein